MTSTAPVAVIPDDLIKEVLSFLPVNSLVRFRCVSKFWKTLISDPYFVKLHLKNSQARNPLFTLITYYLEAEYDYHVVPYSLHRLIENPPFTLTLDPYYHVSNKGCDRIVGTCNGLILLLSHSELFIYFRVWNPATRTISPIFGRFMGGYAFCFGCDESTDTYKIVASGVRSDGEGTHVSILSLGENFWYSIHPGPVPYHMERDYDGNDAVYLCSTVNWLAIIGDGSDLTVEHFVISSLDLKTETFNQYSLPTAFDELPRAAPIVAALGGFLSFSYFYMKTDFVIWQMNEFGVEDSWTQFLKISLQNLLQNFQRDYDHLSDSEYSDEETNDHFQLVPVLLSEDADTLVLKCGQESRAILYNWRDIRVERTKITTSSTIRNSICWYSAKNFVESLVSTF